jgi:hypothetical protein
MAGEIVFGHPDSYSFLFEAAAEARAASRRHWAPGGAADRRYPVQPSPYWPVTPPPAANEDLAARRRRRQR